MLVLPGTSSRAGTDAGQWVWSHGDVFLPLHVPSPVRSAVSDGIEQFLRKRHKRRFLFQW